VHYSSSNAPRCNVWDKGKAQAGMLAIHAVQVQDAKRQHPMVCHEGGRPYVGRWQFAS
jgi:hypothetical protein